MAKTIGEEWGPLPCGCRFECELWDNDMRWCKLIHRRDCTNPVDEPRIPTGGNMYDGSEWVDKHFGPQEVKA